MSLWTRHLVNFDKLKPSFGSYNWRLQPTDSRKIMQINIKLVIPYATPTIDYHHLTKKHRNFETLETESTINVRRLEFPSARLYPLRVFQLTSRYQGTSGLWPHISFWTSICNLRLPPLISINTCMSSRCGAFTVATVIRRLKILLWLLKTFFWRQPVYR